MRSLVSMFVLIGHRGVGKSSLGMKLSSKFKVVDLDTHISSNEGRSVAQIFEEDSEKKFRELEKIYFKTLCQEEGFDVIVVGAGFPLDSFSDSNNLRIIWVRRETDRIGRVFLDRPRLNKKVDPLDEYFEIYEQREKSYREQADFDVFLNEGANKNALEFFESFFQGSPVKSKGYVTFFPGMEALLTSGLCFEFRTDIIAAERAIGFIEQSRSTSLFAIRTDVPSKHILRALELGAHCDFPIDLKKQIPQGFGEQCFVSSHERLNEDEIIEQSTNVHLKWAPEVYDFDELIEFHGWCKNRNVSFLPRSVGVDESWQWYRSLVAENNKFNYVRLGEGSQRDQPLMHNRSGELEATRAAVLGYPVLHSRSPGFHDEMFNGNYFAIPTKREDFNFKVLNFLVDQLGVTCFSVTSPLKDEARDLLNGDEPLNTLYCDEGKWFGVNTDKLAIRKICSELERSQVLVWGRGALGRQLSKEGFEVLSVRENQNLEITGSYNVLLWATGPDSPVPKFEKTPSKVVDVNYFENSRARVFAQENDLDYVSGLEFFKIQAAAQQEWWRKQGVES